MRGWEEVKKPILWVLAGRIVEFEWIVNRMYEQYGSKEQSPYDIRYISDEQRIRGFRDCFYICEGNWFKRSDYEYIIEIMRHSGFKEIGYSDLFGESRSSSSDGYADRYEEIGYNNEFLTEEEMTI